MSQLSQGDPTPKEGLERSPSNHRSSSLPETAKLSQPMQSLHPVLQSALDSLDVDLEEELARYRRHILVQQRVAKQTSSYPALTATSPFSFEELGESSLSSPRSQEQSIAAVSGMVSPSIPPAPAEDILSTTLPVDTSITQRSQSHGAKFEAERYEPAQQSTTGDQPGLVAVSSEQSRASESDLAVSQQASLLTDSLPPNPDGYLESSEELLKSIKQEEERANAIASATETETTGLGSSRALRGSLLTPLGLGSILLLILSSATLGYLILRPSTLNAIASWMSSPNSSGGNPSNLESGQQQGGLSNLAPDLAAGEFDPLRANNLSSLPAVVDTDQINGVGGGATQSDSLSSNGVEGTPAEDTVVASRSDAASDGRALSVSSPSQSPASLPVTAPQPAPRRVAAPTPTPRYTPPTPAASPPSPVTPTSTTASPLPSPPPERTTEPVSAPDGSDESNPVEEAPLSLEERETPPISVPPHSEAIAVPTSSSSPPVSSPSPASTPTTPPVSAAPIQEDLYYVTTPYTGDQSLEAAQDAVSGSYVRSFPEGTQVQMGAFSSESGAEAFVQNLQDQGISAEVYEGDEQN
ncbi:MAG: hypothetical protein F6K09_03880 [Merismopedia sp. SIO2A8]|nr:hypothetical protein [Symploca sp. SIO2B6]NET47863.1 hypothetical protein [Merismopedia sp. SIO2A8]